AFAAAATDTLRVGMLVLGNDYKHPAVVAKEAATLDVLSGGRLEFGLGAGWMTSDYTALGLPYDSPGTRIARLEEALAVVKGAWIREGAGDRFDDLELQIRYFVASITDDAQALADAMAPAFGVSPDEALSSGGVLAGSADQVCDTLLARREEWGVSYVVLGDD